VICPLLAPVFLDSTSDVPFGSCHQLAVAEAVPFGFYPPLAFAEGAELV
jgi:hypothetical protein